MASARVPDTYIYYEGRKIPAVTGEPIAAALLAAGIRVLRYTPRKGQPRSVFCGIGRCNDCKMTVNGTPNIRTCITPVEEGMTVETQIGLGKWMEQA